MGEREASLVGVCAGNVLLWKWGWVFMPKALMKKLAAIAFDPIRRAEFSA